MAIYIYHLYWHTLITTYACLSVWINGLQGPAAWVLIAIGVAVDLNKACYQGGVLHSVAAGSSVFPVRIFVGHGKTFWAYFYVWVFMVAVYVLAPDACWSTMNRLFYPSYDIATHWFEEYPDFCTVPHGAALLLIKVVKSYGVVVILSVSMLSCEEDYERYTENLWEDYKTEPDESSLVTRNHLIGCVILTVIGFMFMLLPYNNTLYETEINNKILVPANNISSYIVIGIIHFITALLYLFYYIREAKFRRAKIGRGEI